MASVISLVPELKVLLEGFMVMSLLYYYYRSTQENGVIHGERSTGVGCDGMTELVWLVSAE